MINEKLAQEFVELHNAKIRGWHEQSGDSGCDFFLRATASQVGQDNGMGELVFEISGDDSRTGNPILFEVAKSNRECDCTPSDAEVFGVDPVSDALYD